MGSNGEGSAASDESGSLVPGLSNDTALEVLARCSRMDYGALSCLNNQYGSLMSSGYLYKLREKVGKVEHWVYLSCELKQWEGFDPETRRWTKKLPELPGDICFTHADKESLAVGTELLVFGKQITEFAIWKYSLVSKEWTRGVPMKKDRCLFGSSSYGGVGVVAGGIDYTGESLKCAEMYNSRLGSWRTLAELNVGRKLCSGFAMDGKFYVIGGMTSQRKGLTCGEEYDVETNKWRKIENMYPLDVTENSIGIAAAPPLVGVANNELYWAEIEGKQVHKYNKQNNSWRVVKKLPECVNNRANGWGIGFRGCGKRLLLITGATRVVLLFSWIPDSDSDSDSDWDLLSVLPCGSFVYNCAIMGC